MRSARNRPPPSDLQLPAALGLRPSLHPATSGHPPTLTTLASSMELNHQIHGTIK
ncbi:hypothetical protein ACP70R_048148 [Stipagrostis hirtigluma subsp. patula]